MALIGTQRRAEQIASQVRASYYDGGEVDDKVWRWLGSGCYRDAYLHIASGVVYKVENDDDDDYGNVQEFLNSRLLRRKRWQNVYIPKVALFDTQHGPVVAMEYIQGNESRFSFESSEARRELHYKAGFADMHGGNFFVKDGLVIPIDMASPLYPHGTEGKGWFAKPDARILHGED